MVLILEPALLVCLSPRSESRSTCAWAFMCCLPLVPTPNRTCLVCACFIVSTPIQRDRPDRPLVQPLHLLCDCCNDVILVQEHDFMLCRVYIHVHLVSWDSNVLHTYTVGISWTGVGERVAWSIGHNMGQDSLYWCFPKTLILGRPHQEYKRLAAGMLGIQRLKAVHQRSALDQVAIDPD